MRFFELLLLAEVHDLDVKLSWVLAQNQIKLVLVLTADDLAYVVLLKV